MLKKQLKKIRRHKRVRAKISGTTKIPRLCVFRSNKHITAQLIDDKNGKTLAFASDFKMEKVSEKELKSKKGLSGKKAIAYIIGTLIAQKAQQKKIKKVVFDRGGYRYHGRVKALAEGAREAGLQF